MKHISRGKKKKTGENLSDPALDILVSKGCHNNYHWVAQITEIYSCTVLGARSLKSRCQQSRAPSEGSGGDSFHTSYSFWWLLAFLGLWQHHTNLGLHFYVAFSPGASHCLSSPLFARTLVKGFTPYPDLVWSYLITAAKTYFQIRWHSGWAWILGHTSQPTTAGLASFGHALVQIHELINWTLLKKQTSLWKRS